MRDPDQDLKWAKEHKMPEVAVPYPLINWMLEEPIPDDLSPLKESLRYSPEAIRTMIISYMTGIFHPDKGYIGPKSFQASLNAGIYGLFNDLITHQELDTLLQRKVLRTNVCNDEEDILISKHPQFHSRMFGTMEGAALDPKWIMPGSCKVFFNGTWNGFPHAGHILYLSSTLDQIHLDHNIPYEKMVVMVACEQNQEIKFWGKDPFIDTIGRMSLMSYIPYVDLVAPSGSWGEGGDPEAHWAYKMGLVRPDFISIEKDDPYLERKVKRSEALGITVLRNWRHGAYTPQMHDDGSVTLERVPGNVLSSTNLLQDNVAEGDFDYRLTNPIAHLMTKKQIREMLYGKRVWF